MAADGDIAKNYDMGTYVKPFPVKNIDSLVLISDRITCTTRWMQDLATCIVSPYRKLERASWRASAAAMAARP